MALKPIAIQDLNLNPITIIGEKWMLITAGSQQRGYNTMTASWGHLGSIWGRTSTCGPSAVVYIRQSRYTKQFVDREDLFTLSVLPEQYRKALGYLGSKSGRDEDKVAAVGLTPVFDGETTYFAEAELVLVCRKLYRATLTPENILDKTIVDRVYGDGDLHDMYIGEIIRALAAE